MLNLVLFVLQLTRLNYVSS